MDFDEPVSNLQLIGDARFVSSGGTSDKSAGDGYLSLSDAASNQFGAVAFPHSRFEELGLFILHLDLRIGGGTEQPGNGLSVNLARPSDPIFTAIESLAHEDNTKTITDQFATGQFNAGVQTGVSVVFDEWHTGSLDPKATPGISTFVDGELIRRVPFPTLNGAFDDPTSLQTGNTSDDLGWAELTISVAPKFRSRNESVIVVRYKQQELFSETIPLLEGPMRTLLAAQTGDGYSNHHVDNFTLITEISLIPEYNPGDFNEDGAIDMADFQILQGNMNTAGPATEYFDGDFDYSGRIEIADFVLFRSAWQDAHETNVAVPEPNSFILASIIVVAASCRRKKRR